MKNAKLAKRKPQKARAKPSAKSRDLPFLSPEVLPARDDESENLLRLERMLTRAQGFLLAFARVNVPTQRAELVKEIRRRVERQGTEIIEIDLQAPVRDFLNDLLRRLAKVYLTKVKSEPHQLAVAESAPRFAIFVYGLEHSIPSSETYHPVLSVINYKRENFRQHLAAPLVIWVPEYALQAIIEGAPDFWAWRSGVFEFVAPHEEVEKTWLTIEPERGQIELSNMTLEEKRKRIHLLSGLLAEYEEREDADASEIAAIRFDLLDRLGKLHYFLGEYQHALEFHQRALNIAEKSNYQAGVALSLHHIGMIHLARGDYAAALVEYEKSLKISEKLRDRAGVAISLHQIGRTLQACGDYWAALVKYEKALKISEELGDRAGVAGALHQIGLIQQDRGDYTAALTKHEKVLKILEELGDRVGVATSLHQIGNVHYLRGDNAAALAEYEKSLKIKETLGNRAGLADSMHQIGRIHQARGDYAAAQVEYEKALKIFEELGNRTDMAITHGQIGKLFTETARYSEAFEHLLFAHATFVELRSPNANIVANMLQELRAKWGAENFDAAWQKATSEAVPEWLKA
jgi:tetratricopeptide (TPR) repeat protein